MADRSTSVRYSVQSSVLEHVLAARGGLHEDDAEVPSVDQLRQMVEATFWASLDRDEGRPVFPRVGFFSPWTGREYRFSRPVPLTVQTIAKLALTLPRFDVLGLQAEGDESLSVWGIGLPRFGRIVVRAVAPGTLILSAGHPIAVLRNERADIIDRTARERAHALLAGVEVPGDLGDIRARNVLLRVARSVARLQHGGSIAIVPVGNAEWRQFVEANSRDAHEPYTGLSTAIADSHAAREGEAAFSLPEGELRERVQQRIDEVALLTSTDGALVIDSRLDVLSFGAKLVPPSLAAPVKVFQPLVGNEGHDVPLDEIGGMRHQSAARFVAAASGTSAIVVSQDGPISVIGRDGERVVQLKSAELLPG